MFGKSLPNDQWASQTLPVYENMMVLASGFSEAMSQVALDGDTGRLLQAMGELNTLSLSIYPTVKSVRKPTSKQARLADRSLRAGLDEYSRRITGVIGSLVRGRVSPLSKGTDAIVKDGQGRLAEAGSFLKPGGGL